VLGTPLCTVDLNVIFRSPDLAWYAIGIAALHAGLCNEDMHVRSMLVHGVRTHNICEGGKKKKKKKKDKHPQSSKSHNNKPEQPSLWTILAF
jgi:hypothetical protein